MDPSVDLTVVPEPWFQRALAWVNRWRYLVALFGLLLVFGMSSIPNTRPPRVHGLDKAEHLLEYFVLGLILLNLAKGGALRARPLAILGALAALIAVALVDESYQRWIPGRSFDWYDVLASVSGGLAALVGLLLVRAVRHYTSRSGGP